MVGLSRSLRLEVFTTEIDDSRRKMLDFNVLTILLSKLEDNDQIVLKSAMTFIEELAKHGMRSHTLHVQVRIHPAIDDSRRKMWESNFIASLLSKLEDKCPSFVRRSAIDTIGQLAGYGMPPARNLSLTEV